MGARENKLPISQNDLAHNILPVFSQFLGNLNLIFSGPHEKFSLVTLQ